MPSVNEEVADAIRIHALGFERFSADLRRRVLALLLALERDLVRQVRDMDPTEPLVREFREARLAALLEQTRASIVEAYSAINAEVTDDLAEVADIAAAGTVRAVNDVVGAEIMTVGLAPEKARALVDDTMIEGAPSKDWWSRQAGDVVFRFRAAVQMGYAQGETVQQITRRAKLEEIITRVKGTPEAGYRDGMMESARRHATSLVHTSVQAVSNSARLAVFRENADVLDGVQQLSTLDSRTCVLFDTKVSMPGGTTVLMGTIRTGDTVLGGSLVPRSVLGTKKSSATRLARVTLDNGQQIVCTPDHLFLVQEGIGQCWVEAEGLVPGTDLSCKMLSVQLAEHNKTPLSKREQEI